MAVANGLFGTKGSQVRILSPRLRSPRNSSGNRSSGGFVIYGGWSDCARNVTRRRERVHVVCAFGLLTCGQVRGFSWSHPEDTPSDTCGHLAAGKVPHGGLSPAISMA